MSTTHPCRQVPSSPPAAATTLSFPHPSRLSVISPRKLVRRAVPTYHRASPPPPQYLTISLPRTNMRKAFTSPHDGASGGAAAASRDGGIISPAGSTNALGASSMGVVPGSKNGVTPTETGGTGRPVFHENVLQALGSLRQRNRRVFASAVGRSRALSLERLGSGGGGQEGGKGLYPCLVQLQCLAEMEEVSGVLLSSRKGRAAGATAGVAVVGSGGDAVIDAVGALEVD